MKNFLPQLAFVTFVIIPDLCCGQGTPYVKWSFKSVPVSSSEIMLTLHAHIAPGWHLYSQYIKEGGPQPTRFRFDQSHDYASVGQPDEKGKQNTYYDEIYEMEITWYVETVLFLQKFRLTERVTTVKGNVEYMICNKEVCVPDKVEFAIDVNLLR